MLSSVINVATVEAVLSSRMGVSVELTAAAIVAVVRCLDRSSGVQGSP